MTFVPGIFVRRRSAFSLLELLVVLAILSILAVAAAISLRGTLSGADLASAQELLVGELDLAKQQAVAEGMAFQVRILELPSADGSEPAYRAIQRWNVARNQPATRVQELPRGIIVSETPEFSSLIGASNLESGVMDVPSRGSVTYKGVTFLANGTTSLDPGFGDGWFFSLRKSTDPELSDRPAASFVTIQIDPLNGNTRVFRP